MMENEKVVYNPLAIGTPGMGGGLFGGQGGLLEGILLAAILGRGGNGLFGGNTGGAGSVVTEQNISDLRQQVSDVKSTVIADLQAVQADLQAEICDSQKDSIKAMYEAKIAGLQSTNEITNKIGNVETEIQSVKCALEGKISASTQAVLNQLNADKLDAKNDEIAELRSRNRHMEQTILFSNQLNSITSQIDSMNQKLTNQVVQFGAGNVATPVATNNQVK